MAIQTRPVSNNEAYDRWQEEVLTAATEYRKGAWALADKLLEGMDRFGEAMFFQVVNDTGLSQHTVDNYLSLARAFPISRRRENVSLSIHDAVRKLPDEEANAMLMLAEKYQWTRENVRDRVKAWKAGDLTALQAGWKPKLPPKLSAQTPDAEDAEIIEDDDKPVFDTTAAGADMDAELRAENRREFKEARAERSFSTATEKLTYALSLVKAMRSDPEFRAALDTSSISASDCELEGHWLVNLAREVRHRQNIEFDNPRKPRAAQAEATADGEADGTLPRTASPDNSQAKASEDETGTDARGAATPDGLASRASDGAGSVDAGSASNLHVSTTVEPGFNPNPANVQTVDGLVIEQPDDIPVHLRR